MANYTMELRTIIEQPTQYESGLSRNEVIEEGRKKLFDFDYPFFDDEYKAVFETHFIKNFYMREIGFETEALFKFRLETWLEINMPYYNRLFESELLEFDPLKNSEMDVTHEKTSDKTQNDERDVTDNEQSSEASNTDYTNTTHSEGETDTDSEYKENQQTHKKSDSETDTENESFNRGLESDNPDSRLAISSQEGEGVIDYASKITENKTEDESKQKSKEDQQETTNTDGTTSTKEVGQTDTEVIGDEDTTKDATRDKTRNDKLNSEIVDIEDFVQHRVGKIGVQSYSKLLMEFRESFLRLEKQIFEDMQELFMLVY